MHPSIKPTGCLARKYLRVEKMGFGIVLFIEKSIVFICAVALSEYLPKRFKFSIRGLVCLWIVWSLFNVGCFGEWKQTPPQSVATLMEQVRGDQLHWNGCGKPASKWEKNTHRNYEKNCQRYALEELGELGPAASEAGPELIRLYGELEDFNTGDGVYGLQSEIARTLGKIGEADAIEPMVAMLLKKSLSPDQKHRSSIHWHDEEYENVRSYLKNGTGPQAILMGLMLMPREHHVEIVERLKTVRTQVEQSGLFNVWAKFEIDRGLRFFESDEKTQARLRNYIAIAWCLDEADFEKMLAQEERPEPRWVEGKVKLPNGEWAKVSSAEQLKAIIAENRKTTAQRKRAIAD